MSRRSARTGSGPRCSTTSSTIPTPRPRSRALLLRPEDVAARAVGLLDRPRAVLTIPRWRGAFVRLFDAFPGLATRLLPLVAARRAAAPAALEEADREWPRALSPPSATRAGRAWRVARAILPLPFVATVVVPALIVAVGDGSTAGTSTAPRERVAIVAGVALIAVGLALFVATVRLFASVGRGTLAPWDPPERLVVAGPYRYLRHPMISGVALVLAGEALVARLAPRSAIWLAAFVAVNAIYLPLVEEPALVRRFGADYERYMANVRRWVPRLRPWNG